MMVSLAEVWRSFGLEPDAVVGHSQGEIAAATVAGALSLEDGARVAVLRSRALCKIQGRGGMAAVESAHNALEERLKRFQGRLVIAAINGPRSSLVAGESAALEVLLDELKVAGVFARRVQVSYASHSPDIAAVRETVLSDLAGITPRTAVVPLMSSVRVEPLLGPELDASYWYENLRRPVRFMDAALKLAHGGHLFFVEVSPHPVLNVALESCFEAIAPPPAVVGTLEREVKGAFAPGSLAGALGSLGELFVRGLAIDPEKLSPVGRVIDLPTYAFQRESYWLDSARGPSEPRELGLIAAEHPWLRAQTSLATSGATLFSARLSTEDHAWLLDHSAFGTPILPGASILEMALFAGEQVGARKVEALTMLAPVELAPRTELRLQLTIGSPDEHGRRELAFHSRPVDADAAAPWTEHATGTLSAAGPSTSERFEDEWPPDGAESVDLAETARRLEAAGLSYGPAFQGLRALYKYGETLYAEIALPDGRSAGFALHPVLLDSALQSFAAFENSPLGLPFEWTDAERFQDAGTEIRARIDLLERGPDGATASVACFDPDGRPIARAGALAIRRTNRDTLGKTASPTHLYEIAWRKLNARAAAHAALEVVIVDETAPDNGDLSRRIAAGLDRLKSILAEARSGGKTFVLATRGAVRVGPEDRAMSVGARSILALWRSARMEDPDRRLIAIDLDPRADIALEQVSALLAEAGEPEIALRGGVVLAPRLVRSSVRPASRAPLDAAKTAFITGGTGELGRELARHLVRAHGLHHLVLSSRQGLDAAGARELVADLESLGAETVEVLRLDVADSSRVAEALAVIRAPRPLGAIFHLAAALDDGLVESMTEERMERTLRPKVDGALALDALTRSDPLDAFVLFSSLTGVLGGPGQSNYAAASAALDAIAEQRRDRGLPAESIAFGLWIPAGVGLTRGLGSLDLLRLERRGIRPLKPEEALAALDAALVASGATSVIAKLDLVAVDEPHPMLRELVPRASVRSKPAGSLLGKLAGLTEDDRRRSLIEVVRAEAARVLGLASAEAVRHDQPIQSLGLDSLMAVELRKRLSVLTETRLPATLAFDHPTPERMAIYLDHAAFGSRAQAAMKPRARRASREADEAIAIVSMACRLPGDVTTPEEYWRLLDEGRDVITPFPSDRGWDVAALYDPDPDAAGKTYLTRGAFLTDIDRFDAGFFGINAREAIGMEPQQRLLLEVAWEAIERAGLKAEALSESQTGVYIGSMGASEYRPFDALESLDGYAGTGSAASVMSGRLAYTLGLVGPAMTIDTACSSSLVALHLACQALRQGDCDRALVGGVQLMLTPFEFVEFSRVRGLPRDGRCKAFSAAADGAGLSEGCGVVVLERLSDALKSERKILAVVRGSAVNQDGRSQGLTAPNGPSQEQVIRRALELSCLSPTDIDAIEAHGTGTPLGDPIEVGALTAVFSQDRAHRPLYLGSSKSNLAHSQAAAGVVGLMKMVLALVHERLPKTLHAEEPSPHIDWAASGLSLLTEAVDWKRGDRVRRAGVSSFGISGTNAHVVIEEAPEPRATTPAADDRTQPLLLLLSAKSDRALRDQAARLEAYLDYAPDISPSDVAHTLAVERTAFERRALVIAKTREEIKEGLEAISSGEKSPRVVRGVARTQGKVVFVCPGQGSEWQEMARGLLGASSVFAEQIRLAERALAPHFETPLLPMLQGELGADWMEKVDHVQPALWSVMIGLAAMWRSFGVEADAVIGTSQGEIAAAVISGALSLEEGARIVGRRSRLLKRIVGKGGMAAVELAPEALEERIRARYAGRLSVGVINGPQSIVVSGDREAIEDLVGELEREGIFVKQLAAARVAAGHSQQVEPLKEELLWELEGLSPKPARVPFFSTVRADLLTGVELDARYWYDNMREPVRLSDACARLLESGHRFFIELSPHALLRVALEESFEHAGVPGAWIGSLRRGEGGLDRLLSSLADIHARGLPIDLERVLPPGRSVDLPTYAFDRESYWLKTTKDNKDAGDLGLEASAHPWLRAGTPVAETGGHLFSARLALAEHRWLQDHSVLGTALVPAAAWIEMALAAGRTLGLSAISEMTLLGPLTIQEESALRLQLWADAPAPDGGRAFTIHSRPDASGEETPWTCHVAGVLGMGKGAAPIPPSMWPPEGAEAIDLDAFYARLAGDGYEYGPAFRGLRRAFRQGNSIFAEVTLPESEKETAARYDLHPALLDSLLQAAMLLSSTGGLMVEFEWKDVEIRAGGGVELRARIDLVFENPDAAAVSVSLFAPAGRIGELVSRRTSAGALRGAFQSKALHRLDWVHVPHPGEGSVAGKDASAARTVVIGGSGRLSQRIGAETVVSPEGVGSAASRIVIDATDADGADLPEGAHRSTHDLWRILRALFQDELLSSAEIVVVTRGAVALGSEPVTDLLRSPIWGLVRSARQELPDRTLRLIDLGRIEEAALEPALAVEGEPELAIRGDRILAPRLARASDAGLITIPDAASWRIVTSTDGIAALHAERVEDAPLQPRSVRVRVRAAGLNFRDVLTAQGMLGSDATPLGIECSGVVVECGPGVDHLRPGDRVMGLARGAFAPTVVAPAEHLVPMPERLGFAEAATLPVAFLTASIALEGLCAPGRRVLIHGAAGGVGLAAVRIAQRAGAEVFATASPSKWPHLRRMSIDDAHLASSRNAEFERRFLETTGGAGVDIVLNSLSGELVDASLRLLVRGGDFIELGKLGRRDPSRTTHGGVRYRVFDLLEVAAGGGIQSGLREIARCLESGEIEPLPYRAFDVERAREAFHLMAESRHVGKVLLVPRRPPDLEGTVLITGGLGTLGREVARHLVRAHGVRHLVLVSRRGADAPEAAELVGELRAQGAETVEIAAVDARHRRELEVLLAAIPCSRPLTAVIHASAVFDDGLVVDLTPERIDAVLGPKLDAAWHLHELTRSLDLASFVLFSSATGVLGNGGQSSYSAANTFLDALAAHRRSLGLAGQSLAWGLWAPSTGAIQKTDLMRLARRGLKPMSVAEGLELLDAALGRPDPLVLPFAFEPKALWAADEVPAVLRGMVRSSSPSSADSSSRDDLARLAALPEGERRALLLERVRHAAASVLGLIGPSAVASDRPLRELGLDSMTAVELKHQLSGLSPKRMSVASLFEDGTPALVAARLSAAIGDAAPQSLPARAEAQNGAQPQQVGLVARRGRLSAAQARFWILHRLIPRPEVYNCPITLRHHGLLDPDRFEQALELVVARHEQLRMHVVARGEDGEPAQRILPWVEAKLVRHDLRAIESEAKREEALRALSAEEAARPFDLERAPLFRFTHVALGEDDSAILLTFHHLIFDAGSLAVVLEEIREAYRALESGRPLDLWPAPSYLAHVEKERAWLGTEDADRERDWWHQQLDGLEPLELPVDRPTPENRSHQGGHVDFRLSSEESDALEALGRRTGVTPFVVIAAAWSTLLHRYSGQPDFAIGTATYNRDDSALEHAIGLFVNTLPIRCELGGDPTVLEVLERTRRSVLGVLDHQDLPLSEIVRAAAPRRESLTMSPLFRATLVLEPSAATNVPFLEGKTELFGGSAVGEVDGTAKFDLGLTMVRWPEGYQAWIRYATDLFEHATVVRMAGHLRRLLDAMTRAPEQLVSEIGFLGEEERASIFALGDTGPAALPMRAEDMFETWVKRSPGATALVDGREKLSYAEVAARAKSLASALSHWGVSSDSRVGILLERSADAVIAMLATVQAGAAYVPLDSNDPLERRRAIMEDASLKLVITRSGTAFDLPSGVGRFELEPGGRSSRPSKASNGKNGKNGSHPSPRRSPNDLAYVIFTSGSTGRPKGVAVTHAGLATMVAARASQQRLAPGRRVLFFSSFGFDASVFDVWGTLGSGACLIVAPEDARSSARVLERMLREVDAVVLPPAMLAALSPDAVPATLDLAVAGEALPGDLARRWSREGRTLRNLYGPTEVTVFTTAYRVRGDELGSPPIGRPNPGVRHYVLDAAQQPVPIGVPGELYLAGVGVARGYLKAEAEQEQRFLADPFMSGGRMFRTGDRVRWRDDGNLEFLGRADEQVKIRGFRVELGEIEAALRSHPNVRDVAVVKVGDGSPQLVAHVVPRHSLDAGDLRAHVARKLPAYMVPSVVVSTETLPLTLSGKVDRRTLGARGIPMGARIETSDTAPLDPIEASIARIWREILELERLGPNDDFFALGGDSLSLLRVFDRVEEELGERIGHARFLATPSVAGMARLVRERSGPDRTILVPLAEGSRLPLFCVVAGYGDLISLRELARAVGPDQPFYGCQPPETNGDVLDFESLIRHYLSAIRGAQSKGPYHLSGYSSGGLIAFELARRLEQAGERVEFLGLLDTISRIGRAERLFFEFNKLAMGRTLGLTRERESRIARVMHFVAKDRGLAQHVSLLEHYQPGPYRGRVTLFVPRLSHQRLAKFQRGWREVALGGLEVCVAPGDHENFIRAPLVEVLAAKMRARLKTDPEIAPNEDHAVARAREAPAPIPTVPASR
jgi:amino acid adenylation domain-containing protein